MPNYKITYKKVGKDRTVTVDIAAANKSVAVKKIRIHYGLHRDDLITKIIVCADYEKILSSSRKVLQVDSNAH
jgi:hypothetical protein